MRLLSLTLLVLAASAWAGEGLTLADALAQPNLRGGITGGDPLSVALENRSDTAITLRQPAGLICSSTASAARVITLRALQLPVPAHQTGEASIPCAALASRPPIGSGSLRPTTESEPRLAPLLDYFARHDDLPRLTAQLLVLCVMEDITFAAWRRFLAAGEKTEPTPQEVVVAIDALGVLRELDPPRSFALAADAGLKFRALRNPAARAKAAQFFGLALPDLPPPPELGALLHRKAGDNCPICRQRALMQPREDGL